MLSVEVLLGTSAGGRPIAGQRLPMVHLVGTRALFGPINDCGPLEFYRRSGVWLLCSEGWATEYSQKIARDIFYNRKVSRAIFCERLLI